MKRRTKADVEKVYAKSIKLFRDCGAIEARELMDRFCRFIAQMYPNPDFRVMPIEEVTKISGITAEAVFNFENYLRLTIMSVNGAASTLMTKCVTQKILTVDELVGGEDDYWKYPWELTEAFMIDMKIHKANSPVLDRHRAPWNRIYK